MKRLFLLLITGASLFGAATDLFISEYIEGSSSNKYIEIFNGTASAIDLSDYQLLLFSNGAATAGIVTLSGTLNSGSVIVYKNSSAAVYLGAATSNSAVNFNGDDAVAIKKISTGNYIDIFGRIGEDPGTAWTDGTTTTLDRTLVRNSNVSTGITSNPSSGFPTLASEWTQYAQNDVSNLGAHSVDYSLPVELSSWKCISSQGLVKLLWTTDSEIENQGFIIERTLRTSSFDGAQDDGSQWKEIASFATNDDLLGQGSTSAQNEYFFIDKQVKVGKTYSYRLSDVDYRGNVTQHAAINVTVKDAGKDLKPSDIKLHEAFPNPFNPSVNLSFTLEKEAAALSLEIYDIQGALVQTLSSGYQDMGTHDFSWDGHDGLGNAVPSGVYLVRLGAGSLVQIQRVTLLR